MGRYDDNKKQRTEIHHDVMETAATITNEY